VDDRCPLGPVEQCTTCTQIEVVFIEQALIKRREKIKHGQSWAEFEERVAKVHASAVGIERAVAREEVDVALAVGGESTTALPDPAAGSVRRGVECGDLLQSGSIVAQHSAMVGIVVAQGREG
jgi:hypothetical protein